MLELSPNPDNCARFEPNPFKKEKCKHCGRIWREHEGVISAELLKSYVQAQEQAAEQRLNAETAAKERAKAKAQAKKKNSQAVEDEWLFDGSKGGHEDSDDDMGFRMVSAEELNVSRQPSVPAKPEFKVRNLIDFSECDTAGSPDMAKGALDLGGLVAPMPNDPVADLPNAPAGRSDSWASGLATMDAAVIPQAAMDAAAEDLRHEIDRLQLMLKNAQEEKNIEIAIVRDDVHEKHKTIEELTEQRQRLEVELRDTKNEVETLRRRAESPEAPASIASLLAEARVAASRAAQALSGPDAAGEEQVRTRDTLSLSDLEAELRALRDATASLADAASLRTNANAAVSADEGTTTGAEAAPKSLGPVDASPPLAEASRDAQSAVWLLGEKSVQTLREIRLNAERHIARLSERALEAGAAPGAVLSSNKWNKLQFLQSEGLLEGLLVLPPPSADTWAGK